MKQPVTAKVKVTEISEALNETMERYREAVQFCIDRSWPKEKTSHNAIREQSYYEIRDKYDLQSQLAINATKHASEMVKSADSKPEVTNEAIRYNFPRSASVSGDWDELSLATIDGRKKFSITIPECYQQYLDAEVCESTLIKQDGAFYFCFVFAIEVDIDAGSRCDGLGNVVGVDLGVNKLAVTSDASFYGTDVKVKRRQRDEFVADVQSKGTHDAHQRLKEYGGRWKRFMDWKNHVITRRIVNQLEPGDTIAMEELTRIRESNGSCTDWVHKWAFRDLQDKIEYKAHLKGVKVVYVDPKDTSKRCSECGHVSDDNRNGGWFECVECGFTLDADLNAARNIRDVAHSHAETIGQAGSPVNLPTESGNDDSERTPASSEEENTRKPLPHEAKAPA